MDVGRTLLGKKSSGTLVLDQMPDDFEVWIDGRPVDFRRPTAGSAAQVVAEPGTYKLSLRKNGKSQKDVDISIEAGQELRLQVDESFLGRGGNEPTTGKNNRDLVKGNSNANAGESSHQIEQNPSTPNISDEAIAKAIDTTIAAITARQPDQALKELAPVYVSANNHTIPEAHSEYDRVKDLVQLARSLDAYLKAVEKSFARLAPGLAMHVGPHPVSIVDANEQKVILRHKGENIEFGRHQLPSNLEQSLADLVLTDSSPSTNLCKAAGALTHRRLSSHGIDVCKQWVAEAIESKLVSQSILKTIEVFCNRELNRVEKDEPMIAKRWEELEDPAPEFTETHELVRKLEGSLSPIASMFLFPNLPAKQMSLIASGRNQSGFGSSRVHLWNLQSGVHYEAQSAVGPLWSAECSDNGSVVAILSGPAPQTNLQVYSGNLIKPIVQLAEINDSRSAIELSPDGRMLASVGPNESFIRWNLAKRDVVTRIVSKDPVGEANVVCMAIRDNLEAVAVASKDGGVVLWHVSDGRELARFSVDDKDNPNRAIALRFCKGGSRLIVVRQNGVVELYDTNKLTLEKQVRATTRTIVAVGATLSAPNHAKFIAIADSHRNIRLWDGTNLELVGGFHDHHQSPITSVAIDANADKIAVGCEDGGVSVWKKK
jgi:WD40 repeat protein